MNTFISASVAGLTFSLVHLFSWKPTHIMRVYKAEELMNSILAGLVSITGSCNNVSTYGAIVIGFIGSSVYMISKKVMNRLKIDDPVEASQIHGFTGIWGLLAVGLFDLDVGLIYSGSTQQLQVQAIGAAAIAFWSISFCYCYFKVINKIDRLRVSTFYEIIGIDLLMHSTLRNLKVASFVMVDSKFSHIKKSMVPNSRKSRVKIFKTTGSKFNSTDLKNGE